MFRQIDTSAYDVLSYAPTLPVRPGDRAVWLQTVGAVVQDREVPLFALVRSTQGLPLDDRRWWPDHPARRRSGPAVSEIAAADGSHTKGRHTLVVDGDFPAAEDLSSPTLALLERALAGLRAWDSLTPR